MNVWEWVAEYEREAQARGDRERVRLARIHNDAYSFRQVEPDSMLALLEEGRQMARVLREPWWELFFDHWIVETFIYYKDDYRQVIDKAVRCTLELRKPGCEDHPLRFAIFCNLVAAYLCVDPRGYADSIHEALAYLRTEVPPRGGERFLLQARRHWFAFELGRYDEARVLALEELAMADVEPDRHLARHHEIDTWKALCNIAFRQRDFDSLRSQALIGEERARSTSEYRAELALFLLWQAFLARRDRQEERARRLFRQAVQRMSALGKMPDGSWYDAMASYHETGGEHEQAWAAREREVQECLGKGQLAYEAECRLKRCRLLRLMGRPLDGEVEAAREATTRLRDPRWYRAELEKILTA
jgi:hypothetical protein